MPRDFLILFIQNIALPGQEVLFSSSLNAQNAVIVWRLSPIMSYDEMGWSWDAVGNWKK